MKIKQLTSLLIAVSVFASTIAQPALASSNLPLSNWNQSACGLDEYIDAYNAHNPEESLFLEDVARLATPTSPKAKLVQIDHDDYSAQLAVRVARCMIDTPFFDRLDSTLKITYDRYFSDRSARRAISLLLSEIDSAFLNEAQRTQNVMKRNHYLPNVTDAAYYGVWIGSLALWAWSVSRGRMSPALAEANGMTAGALKTQLRQSGNLAQRFLRGIAIKEWAKSAAKFGTAAGVTGFGIGAVLYQLRQQGLISTRAQSATDEAELTYHRLNWLELDCRARDLQTKLDKKVYKDGLKDPEFKKDITAINHLVNDFDFMTDVSQLYYVQTDMPAGMKWDANSISYRDSFIQCPNGFSNADLSLITSNDVRKSVVTVGRTFLTKYSAFLLDPMQGLLNNFLTKHQAAITQAFTEKAPPEVKSFFIATSNELASKLGARVERLIDSISAFVGVDQRLQGRDVLLRRWADFIKDLPPEVVTEMDKLARDLVAALPATLLNQLILNEFAQKQKHPANLIFLFHLGYVLEAGFESKALVNKDTYLLPHEFMFFAHGPLGEVK